MAESTTASNDTLRRVVPDSLTIFSYAWALQALVQLVFYRVWFEEGLVLGWIYVLLTLAVFVFPGKLRLFGAMLVAGIAYYFSIWPFVVNHVLLDPIISITMLAALGITFGRQIISNQSFSREDAEAWFSKFAPVLGAMFAFVYFSIIISKLNWAFFDLDISCLSGMIEEAEANRPLITPLLGLFEVDFYFWFFMVAETLLPIMLVFRRTRLAAFYFGVPFHLLLGLMGHWPFSAFMLALYILVAMPSLKEVLRPHVERADNIRRDMAPFLSGTVAFAILNILVLLSALVLKPSVTWLLWSSVFAAAMLLGAVREHLRNGLFSGSGTTDMWVKKPGLLWIGLAIVVANSVSPYIGFKTNTSIAMYSNMRTEGNVNNHLFMPAIPIFGFQNDLVEVIDSNNDEILELKTHLARYGYVGQEFPVYQAYFELRRAVGNIDDENLEITYTRNGELRTFKRGAEDNVDTNLDQPAPLILRKVAYFRPVFKGETSYCLH